MRDNSVIKAFGMVAKIIAVISGVFAIIELVKNYKYKAGLKEKAEIYLDEELGELQEVSRNVSVISPETIENEKKIVKLFLIMGASTLVVLLTKLFDRD